MSGCKTLNMNLSFGDFDSMFEHVNVTVFVERKFDV